MNVHASLKTAYVSEPTAPGATLHELDSVVLTDDVRTDDGIVVPSGTEGTVVAIWHETRAYEVEFAEPFETSATVKAECVRKSG